MQRMGGLDAGFLYMEMPSHPMHSTHLAVLHDTEAEAEAEGGRRTITIQDVADHVAARLPALPFFRRRLVDVPLGLHHPVWIDDAGFDLAYHLREVALPPPGGDRQLDDAVATIASWPLDHSRPLWRVVLITGLVGGRTGLTLTVHHAMCDGRALLEIVDTLLRPVAAVTALAKDEAAWAPEPVPTRRRLVADALADHRRHWAGAPALARRGVHAARSVQQRREEAAVYVPRSGDVPINVLNESFTAERIVRRTVMPFDDLRAIRRSTGGTINDVFLGVLTGALRDYLGRHQVATDRPLICNNPVLTEPADAPPRASGNHLASIVVPLPVDEDDPVRRVQRITEAVVEAKVQFDLVGPTIFQEALELCAPALAIPVTQGSQRLARRRAAQGRPMSPGFNVVATNVPVVHAPFRVGRYAVERVYLFGLITQGIGLMVALSSQGPEGVVTVTAHPEAVRHIDELVDCLHLALDELRTAAATRASGEGPVVEAV